MGSPGHQCGGSQFSVLFEAHLIDLPKHHSPKVCAEGGYHRTGYSGPQNHRPKSCQRHRQHSAAAADDVRKVPQIDAFVENITHNGRQQQIAYRGNRHDRCRQNKPLPIGLYIFHHFFHVTYLFHLSPGTQNRSGRQQKNGPGRSPRRKYTCTVYVYRAATPGASLPLIFPFSNAKTEMYINIFTSSFLSNFWKQYSMWIFICQQVFKFKCKRRIFCTISIIMSTSVPKKF